MKVLLLPNDPMFKYFQKGEMPNNYFNPDNLFDEIHVISMSDHEGPLDDVASMFGEAERCLHRVGAPKLKNVFKIRRRVLSLADEIKPDVVRAYNPLLMGWIAVAVQESQGIPALISIHNDYSLWHNLFETEGWSYIPRALTHIAFILSGQQAWTLQKAHGVYAVYEAAATWARHHRQDVPVIYNKVDRDVFFPATQKESRSLKLVTVGRQFKGKDPRHLIESLKHIRDVHLTLVGDGPMHESLKALAAQSGLENKTTFVKRLAHEDLGNLYRQHHLFVQSLAQRGVSKPMLESLASGLPVLACTQTMSDHETLGIQTFSRRDESPQEWASQIQNARLDMGVSRASLPEESSWIRRMIKAPYQG